MNETNSSGPFVFARARVYIYAAFCAFCLSPLAFSAEFKTADEAAAGLNAALPADRADAALALAREQAVDRIPQLTARLSNEADNPARKAVVIALANLGAPAFDALVVALADRQPEVRIEAVAGLGRMETPEAAAQLLAHSRRETSDGVLIATLFWLGQLNPTEAADAAAPFLTHPNPHVRIEAAGALGRIASPKAKGHLRSARTDGDSRVRRAVEENRR